MKVYIINRDRLQSPKEMVEFLLKTPGVTPIIMDNDSKNPDLLDWYETSPCEIVRHDLNWGETIMWMPDLNYIEYYGLKDGNYCVTDPDLDLAGIPLNWPDELKRLLVENQWCDKAGFSLEINDLPDNEITREVIAHEENHWHTPLSGGGFRAGIDTSFAAYRSSIHSFECVRASRPYTAKHRNWYYQSVDDIPADEKFYLSRINASHNHWSYKIKQRNGL